MEITSETWIRHSGIPVNFLDRFGLRRSAVLLTVNPYSASLGAFPIASEIDLNTWKERNGEISQAAEVIARAAAAVKE
jgi:hypothetical protein